MCSWIGSNNNNNDSNAHFKFAYLASHLHSLASIVSVASVKKANSMEKAIVFLQWTSMLDLVETPLKQEWKRQIVTSAFGETDGGEKGSQLTTDDLPFLFRSN